VYTRIIPALRPVSLIASACAVLLAGCSSGKDSTGPGGSTANKAPTVQITAPAANASFTTAQAITVVTAPTDADGTIASVKLFLDGSLTAHETKTAAPYSFTLVAGTLAAGPHKLKAVATDNQGATGETEVAVTVTALVALNQPPTVQFGDGGESLKPLEGFESSASTTVEDTIKVTVTASDADGSVASVQLFLDANAAPYATKTTGPYTFTFLPGVLTVGPHILKAVATDNRGATAQAVDTVTIDRVVHLVGIHYRDNGATLCRDNSCDPTRRSWAVYWKNGRPQNLTPGSTAAGATAITLVGKDVYVAGYDANANGKLVAMYWKNGTPVSLTNGANNAVANAIVVAANGDVYTAGYESNGSVTVARYWRTVNGTTSVECSKYYCHETPFR
jgi:hypothetical protein